jgi:hypothetical protein
MGGNARLRSWFLRNFLEAAERELGAPAIAALPARVPVRVRAHLSLDRLKSSAALDTIPLDEGEEALFAFDQALGEGNGKSLERVACEMLARQLVQAAAAVRVGDLFGTVARLQGPLEHPFVDASLTFDLEHTSSGFTLTVGALGRPRASRLLGHLAAGAVLAAERFAREAHADPLKVETVAFADRSRVEARFRRASSAPPPQVLEPAPFSRRSSGAARIGGKLSDEVNRILDRAPKRDSAPPPPESSPGASRFSAEIPTLRRDGQAPHRPSSVPPPPRPSSVPPPPRTSSAPPPPRTSSVPPAPRSSTPPPRRDSAPPPKWDSTPPPSAPDTQVSPVVRTPSNKPR